MIRKMYQFQMFLCSIMEPTVLAGFDVLFLDGRAHFEAGYLFL
jgi:hypothetical protein